MFSNTTQNIEIILFLKKALSLPAISQRNTLSSHYCVSGRAALRQWVSHLPGFRSRPNTWLPLPYARWAHVCRLEGSYRPPASGGQRRNQTASSRPSPSLWGERERKDDLLACLSTCLHNSVQGPRLSRRVIINQEMKPASPAPLTAMELRLQEPPSGPRGLPLTQQVKLLNSFPSRDSLYEIVCVCVCVCEFVYCWCLLTSHLHFWM